MKTQTPVYRSSTGPVQRSALMAADLALVPAGASPVEVWALGGTLEVVQEAREIRPDLQVGLVVNRKDPRSVLGRSGRAAPPLSPSPPYGSPSPVTSQVSDAPVFCEIRSSTSIGGTRPFS